MWRYLSFFINILCLHSFSAQISNTQSKSSKSWTAPFSSSATDVSQLASDSIVDVFSAAFLNNIRKWSTIENVFNTYTSPPAASAIFFDILYDKATRNNLTIDTALAGAKIVGNAIKDTVLNLTSLKFGRVFGETVGQLLLYANILSADNVFLLAKEFSNAIQNGFIKAQPSNIYGIADGFEEFFRSHKLYTAEYFNVKNRYFIGNLYSYAWVSPKIRL